MKLIRCGSCHAVQTSTAVCRYCDKKQLEEIGTLTLHDCAREAYDRALSRIANRQFDEAEVLLQDAAEWNPTEPGVSFYRMLAGLACSNDAELYLHGLDPNGRDWGRALSDAAALAKAQQHTEEEEFFQRIRRKMNEIQSALAEQEEAGWQRDLEAARQQLADALKDTGSLSEKQYDGEIALAKQELALFGLRQRFSAVCAPLPKEDDEMTLLRRELAALQQRIASLSDAAAPLAEPTEIHCCYVQIAAVTKRIQALRQESAMKTKHPWLAEIRDAQNAAARCRQETDIAAALEEQKAQIRALQQQASALMTDYEEHMALLRQYRFREALHYVSPDEFVKMVSVITGIMLPVMQAADRAGRGHAE